MLKKKELYEAKHCKGYEQWQQRSVAGGKGSGKGKGAKGERDTSHLQKDKDGKVLPTEKVGCSYIAKGLECPHGEQACRFSHEAAAVKARKQFLKQTGQFDKDSAPAAAPKAKAKSKPKKDKPAEAVAGGAASDHEDDEGSEHDDDSRDEDQDSDASSESADR